MSKSSEAVKFVPMSEVRRVLIKRPIHIEGRRIESVDDIKALSPQGMTHLTRAINSTLRQEGNG